MGKKKRIITSFSDVITNSSTEVFLIQGPDALRQMIGTGIYKKYQKDFLVPKTEEDVEYFFRFQGKKGFNHNYSIWDLKPLLGNLFNLYLDMNNEFPDKEDVIRAIEIYQKEEDEHGYGGDSTIFEMMSHVNEWYDMYTEYGKGDQWKRLNEAGRTDREIVEFIWPLIKDITGKVFYSFADDCGTSSTAEILWEGGYYSYRE